MGFNVNVSVSMTQNCQDIAVLLYMIRSAEFYRDKQTVHALSGQLNWTLFRDIIHINEILLREAQQ